MRRCLRKRCRLALLREGKPASIKKGGDKPPWCWFWCWCCWCTAAALTLFDRGTALAALGHLQFGDVDFALRFRNLLQVSTAYKSPQLDVVYVPIGQGSGACSAIAAKLALRHPVRVVGVVSSHATTYADSLAAGRVVEAPVTTQLADGMACRVADPEALAVLAPHIDHIVQVSDAEVAAAMQALFTDTHNVAEGAGAAALAAALQERELLQDKTVGLALTGGNVDASVFAQTLRTAH